MQKHIQEDNIAKKSTPCAGWIFYYLFKMQQRKLFKQKEKLFAIGCVGIRLF